MLMFGYFEAEVLPCLARTDMNTHAIPSAMSSEKWSSCSADSAGWPLWSRSYRLLRADMTARRRVTTAWRGTEAGPGTPVSAQPAQQAQRQRQQAAAGGKAQARPARAPLGHQLLDDAEAAEGRVPQEVHEATVLQHQTDLRRAGSRQSEVASQRRRSTTCLNRLWPPDHTKASSSERRAKPPHAVAAHPGSGTITAPPPHF